MVSTPQLHTILVLEFEQYKSKGFPLETENIPLRKHAYLNKLKILSPKNENFQTKKKNLIFFIFLLKT